MYFKQFLKGKKAQLLGISLSLVVLIVVAAFGFQSIGRNYFKAQASGLTPIITPSAANVSTAGTITVAWTNTALLPSGTVITLLYRSLYTGTLTTANTTVNATAPSAITNVTALGVTTSSITTAAPIAASATLTISMTGLTTPSAAGNYTFTISTPISNDYGANFQYVGQYNVVQVRAFIPVSLSFNIRNAADTADTNLCDLGTASTTAVNTCSYRLKVSTNASNGYTIAMLVDGNLTNGSTSITNASAGPTGTTVVAGTEMYGATVAGGAINGLGGTVTLTAPYTSVGANVVAYSNLVSANILSANRPNFPAATDLVNTSLITHRLGISNNTGSGYYDQNVTYRVTPAF
jgi:hypothetical protein